MDLQLVKMSEKFKPQLLDMMDEWTKTGETIIPWAIRKVDYHDFDAYLKSLEESEPKEGYVIRKIPVQQKVSRTTEEFWKMR